MHLYIIRGLPGSGKSTLAHNLVENYNSTVHFEADMFFENNGEYRFNPEFISDAHSWCHSNVVKSLLDGFDVAVSNTFTQLWEMKKYLELKDRIPGLTISVMEMTQDFGSVHDVPKETLEKMWKRWEEIDPEEWGVEVIPL